MPLLWLALACLVSSSLAQNDTGAVAQLRTALSSGTLVQDDSSCCPAAPTDQAAQLTARPQASQSVSDTTTGLRKLGLSSSGRDGYVFVPTTYNPKQPAPLIVTLHAAGRDGLDGLAPLYESAKAAGVILLAPESRDSVWDYLVSATFGPDIAFINAALQAVFQRYNIQQDRIGVQGFSDGATYALTLGIVNGDLFSKVIAYSPGGLYAPSQAGNPHVFISGGTSDPLFPIAQGAAYAACTLVSLGYRVAYVEFPGGHDVPSDVAQQGFQWFLGQQQIGMPSSQTCSSARDPGS